MARAGFRRPLFLVLFPLLLLAPSWVRGEVTRVQILTRSDVADGATFGSTGAYEQLVGKIYFAIDPANARNQVIVDLDKAPKNASGRVEMSADITILKPKDTTKGNGVAFVEVPNRGTKGAFRDINRGTMNNDIGDGLLLRMGYTVIWVGWEFDVADRNGAIRIDVPSAGNTAGMARATFTPNASSATTQVTDLASYKPSDPASAENVLTVRDGPMGTATVIPRSKWTLTGNTVALDGNFEAGRTYELSYLSSNPPIAGLGYAAIRDTVSWIKYAPDALVSVKQTLGFGSSQSGRVLRNFLYLGFNGDEKNRQVFDGVMAHIAGASRIDVNSRWATPTALGQYNATSFPFSDVSQRDPITGLSEGALDNPRAKDFQPKIFYTNTGVEYWGGGRSAALVHSTPDGKSDLDLPANERVYFLAGSQHGPTRFPPAAAGNGQQQENPNAYWYIMRSLVVAMDKWMREGALPPASQYPKLQDKTLVKPIDVQFPSISGVASPRNLTPAVRSGNPLLKEDGAGTPLPYLVPQTDKDGNEIAGIRLPDIQVPLATYTGWNFRNATRGGTSQLYPLLGSYIPFPATKAQREERKDPRAAIEERYPSRESYLELARKAGEKLVADRYLLAEDLPTVLKRAADHWDLLTK